MTTCIIPCTVHGFHWTVSFIISQIQNAIRIPPIFNAFFGVMIFIMNFRVTASHNLRTRWFVWLTEEHFTGKCNQTFIQAYFSPVADCDGYDASKVTGGDNTGTLWIRLSSMDVYCWDADMDKCSLLCSMWPRGTPGSQNPHTPICHEDELSGSHTK